MVGKDALGTITKYPPAFYYMPYYVDQENEWSVNSFSFDRMGQFGLPQRKNSYFFHLGVFDWKIHRTIYLAKRNMALTNKKSQKYLLFFKSIILQNKVCSGQKQDTLYI